MQGNKMRKVKFLSFILALLLCLTACGKDKTEEPVAEPSETPAVEEPVAATESAYIGKVYFSEVMPKNKATLRGEDGEFRDWAEIFNASRETVSLEGWVLTTDRKTTALEGSIGPGELAVFSIPMKLGETLYLKDETGLSADCCPISDDTGDYSFVRDSEGFWIQSKYPTPGLANTNENFDLLQEQRSCDGPLAISEICVGNFTYSETNIGYTDYVEIKNISDEAVSTGGWALSDDDANFGLYLLPDHTLQSGDKLIILCDKDAAKITGFNAAPFSLNARSDRLYLSAPDGRLADYTPIRDVPCRMSYGRVDGEKGFFYLDGMTPGKDNEGRYARRIAEMPVALSADGVFNDADRVTVELGGSNVYYTTDGSRPTEESTKYTGPFQIDSTTIVRAVQAEDGALNSRVLTLSYILNEEDSLPVVSVVADDKKEFDMMYMNGQKGLELPGTISYYGEDGSFTMGAGIKMHGFSTLVLPKKNMSFRFRDCYGKDSLNFKVFGDEGPASFTNLLLRAGGDQTYTIVKNEVCLNMARDFTDSVIASCNKYVAVYINGEFEGIYSLQEKNNEQQYADRIGVPKDSVTVVEEPCYEGNPFFDEVLALAYYEDIEDDPAVYEKLCSVVDIDSFIDFTILQGFFGNWDIQTGNIRYAKSTEGDGKWRAVLYDLDNAFWSAENCFDYVMNYQNQISALNGKLMKVDDYKARFAQRAAEALKSNLTAENVWKEYEKQIAVIDEEAKKDDTISYESWQNHLEDQKDILLEDWDWYNTCARKLSYYLKLDAAGQKEYFGAVK